MNTFVNGVNNELTKTKTENGANAYVTTKSPLVDMFGIIGSIRDRNEYDVFGIFEEAFKEDALLATKMAFYARNIRGGLGERKTFKTIIKHLANKHTEVMRKNIFFVADFGRWDDLYALVGTPLESEIWEMFGTQLMLDIENMTAGNSISLLAKWLKSANTSSNKSRALGRLTAKKLGLTEKEYRITLSVLRNYIDIVEARMSNNEWTEIKFNEVPSRAMSIYRTAFMKRVPEAFEGFIAKVESGEETINAATLYPYDIFAAMEVRAGGWRNDNLSCNDDKISELQWKALPNYIEKPMNLLVMADTSGSMEGKPLNTAVSLAVYFAERNTGEFKDLFLTFSSRPKFVRLKGDTLAEKVRGIEALIDNTDLEAALDLVLKTSVDNKVTMEDMPKAIVVISDGEIDYFGYSDRSWSFLSVMEEKFNAAGYDMPKIVMWNVEARRDTFLEKITNPKIQYISGSSPSAFKSLIDNIDKSAYDLMVATLSDPTYDCITV